MNVVVFDLETYRTRDAEIVQRIELEARAKRPAHNTLVALKQVWDTPQETERRISDALDMTAVDVLIAEPLVVCLDIDNQEITIDMMEHSEEEQLTTLVELFAETSQQTVWVGHNVEFDLSVLLNRLRKYRIAPPEWFPTYRRKRWYGHIHDTMYNTPCPNGLNYISLEAVCQSYGLPPAKSVMWNGAPMDGSRVGEAFRAKEYPLIREYCKGDIGSTKRVFEVQTLGSVDKYSVVVERLRAVDAEMDMSDGARALTKLQILEACGFLPR